MWFSFLQRKAWKPGGLKIVFFYALTLFLLALSFVADRNKTVSALRIAFKRFLSLSSAFLEMLLLVSLALYLVPGRVIYAYLGGKRGFLPVVLASVVGSVTLMPGFVAYPLCGILLKNGVSYTVIAAFSTTLMMVGVVTYPLEKRFFGSGVTVVRNLIGFAIAMLVSFAIGMFFGEIRI